MTQARTDPPKTLPADGPPKPAEARGRAHRWRKLGAWLAAVAAAATGGRFVMPSVETALNTVSTDDAYVNGHVTLVAPRVSGQVSRVLVDDNDRVKKGALLVQLDKEPFEDQVELKKAAVTAAEANLLAVEAQTRGLLAQWSSLRCCCPSCSPPPCFFSVCSPTALRCNLLCV
ncbi:MAG: biotin/lipoyl-binding protein [Isosphaerales bacterium]